MKSRPLQNRAIEKMESVAESLGRGVALDQVEKEAGPHRVALQLEPGIYAGDPRMNPLQTPQSLEFTAVPRCARSARVVRPPASLRSEVGLEFSGEPGAIFRAEVAADLRAVGAVTSSP